MRVFLEVLSLRHLDCWQLAPSSLCHETKPSHRIRLHVHLNSFVWLSTEAAEHLAVFRLMFSLRLKNQRVKKDLLPLSEEDAKFLIQC